MAAPKPIDILPDAEVDADPTAVAEAIAAPLCPVDRMSSRRRNRLCLRIIMIGGLNFLLYTAVYAFIGGDAPNGHREIVQTSAGKTTQYFVRGHFIRTLVGKERQVSPAVWAYSYVHSITLPLTSGAMIISMLILARPHILATMRDGLISGATFITAFAAIVAVISFGVSALFTWDFVRELVGP